MNYHTFETVESKTVNLNLDYIVDIVDTPPLVKFIAIGAEFFIRDKFSNVKEKLPAKFIQLTDRSGVKHLVNFEHVSGFMPESERAISSTIRQIDPKPFTIVSTAVYPLYILETPQQIRAELAEIGKQALASTLDSAAAHQPTRPSMS